MLASACLSCLLASVPVMADDVYLDNGRVFEDVIATVEGDRVRLYLPFGEMSVPLHTVKHIEPGETSLQEFGIRRDALRRNAGSEAPDWVELGRWALDRGLRHSARDAALEAARRNPGADGLDLLMAALDYVFDPELGRWIPHDESLERRGYARLGGRWLSPEQQLARARAEQDAALARQAAEERRLTRALLALAAAELVREPEPPRTEVFYSWPVAFVPHPKVPRARRHHGPRHDPSAIPIERRQPGSLFPIAPSSPHRGAMVRHSGAAARSDTRATTSGG